MRKLKLLFASLALLVGSGTTWAQTDVTSTYLTNPGFDDCTAETSDVAAKTIKNYSSNGWTNANTGSYTTIAVTAYGGGKKVGGSTTPSTKKDGTTVSGNTLGIIAGWADAVKIQSGDITLPAGFYTLTIDHYLTSSTTNYISSSSQFGFVTASKSYLVSSTTFTASTWTTETVTFTLTESTTGKIQVGLTGNNKVGSGAPAVFYDDVKLTYVPFADETDYENLNTAISTVEGKDWGFDKGEYAPYNYVEVLNALASAKAIKQDENNLQSDVQGLTTTLNDASWTANTAEVNAIWDPSFINDYSTSGNVQPIAWTGTEGHDNATDVRWMWNVSSNAGLAATSSSKALFTKYGAFYGKQDGYTMPLNASTYYTIGFKYGGWSDCKKDGYVTMTDPSSVDITLTSKDLPLDAVDGNANTASWKNYSGIFKTDAAGNYILGLRKKDESKQSQYVYGDFVLKTTTIDEATAYYNAVKDEVDDSYNADANGGSEKDAFKAAIDASVPSTIAEIMEAAANLYTLRDAFVAATPKYDAFETERASAIALGVSSEDANAVTMTSADQLQAKLYELYVLEGAAVTAGYTVDYTNKFGSWTKQNLATKNDEHWSGTTVTYFDKWDANGFTSYITNTVTLPAGKYVFKLAARAQTDGINGAFNMSVKVGDDAAITKDFVAKDNTGKGITTSGAVSYSDGEFCNNGNGRGWEWRFIGFELDAEASVELKGYAQIYGGKWVGFSDATLLTTSDNVVVLKDLLNTEIATATDIDKTTNVGTSVFQTPSDAVTALNGAIATAQGVYDDGDATSTEVSDAISDLQAAETTYKNTVNAPAEGKKYYIKVATTGHAKIDKAWLLAAGETGANNPTGYTIATNNDPAAYFAQAFTFTQVSGNTYNISITLPEGEVYLTYGTLNGSAAGWNKQQIQATTNSSNKGEFKIYAGNTENTFKIFNTVDNNYIDCQDGGNIYTDTGIEKELFSVAEASQASVGIDIASGVKFATRIFPFTPTLPSGVEAYTATVAGTALTLTKEETPAANKPYILYAASGYSGDALTGWGTAAATSYVNGALTGVYVATEAPDDSYVLLQKSGKVGFHLVDNTNKPTVGAYRAYLTAPTSARVSAFFFEEETTGIKALEALTSGEVEFFDANGVKQPALRKGLNIVKTKSGKTHKVMVK